MIEIILLDYLEGALKIPVTPEYPEDPPERFVVLRFGDTTRENLLETTVVIAESYEGSLLKAAQLNRQVKAAMDALTELLIGDYGFHHSSEFRLQRERAMSVCRRAAEAEDCGSGGICAGGGAQCVAERCVSSGRFI